MAPQFECTTFFFALASMMMAATTSGQLLPSPIGGGSDTGAGVLTGVLPPVAPPSISNYQPTLADPAKVAACVLRWLTAAPNNVLDQTTMAMLCDRLEGWVTQAKKAAAEGELPPPLTADQQSYIEQLQTSVNKPSGTLQTSTQSYPPSSAVSGKDDDGAAEPEEDTRSVRKEYRAMSDEERERYHKCVRGLNEQMIGDKSKYAILVSYHGYAQSPGAHGGHSFICWHRVFLAMYEAALKLIDPLCSLPYWASTLERRLPVLTDSVLWTKDLAGNSNGVVVDGPFKCWKTVSATKCPGLRLLCRDCSPDSSNMYSEAIYTIHEHYTSYTNFSACVNPSFEGWHGVVHTLVSGQMGEIASAPGDPLFFMHHCFIDYIYERWPLSGRAWSERDEQYPATCSCGVNCNPYDRMKPFPNKTNIDGLSDHFTKTLYRYDPHPVCNSDRTGCVPESKYYFCDANTGSVVSKIKPGGACAGYEGQQDACYDGVCTAGLCVPNSGLPVEIEALADFTGAACVSLL